MRVLSWIDEQPVHKFKCKHLVNFISEISISFDVVAYHSFHCVLLPVGAR